MSPAVAGAVVFGSYLVAMIVIGVLSGRQQKDAADFWVAGRRFGVVAMVLGLMASIMHGGSILSGVAFAGTFGGVAILPFISFAAGFLVILLFFARKLRRTGAFTLADYMGAEMIALGGLVRCSYTAYPNVERWLGNMKKLKTWNQVNEVFNGLVASTKGKQFETA